MKSTKDWVQFYLAVTLIFVALGIGKCSINNAPRVQDTDDNAVEYAMKCMDIMYPDSTTYKITYNDDRVYQDKGNLVRSYSGKVLKHGNLYKRYIVDLIYDKKSINGYSIKQIWIYKPTS